ncbi:MAG: hypothetical protein HC875_23750 [Anaerolineales bacterium]|nr:hypothetical protein [Anaerolineales bacterium]
MCDELCRQNNQVEWAEGCALSYGESASYLAARDMFRKLLRVPPDASPQEVSRALRAQVDQLFAGQAAEIYPYLAHLLEAPLDDESAQRLKYVEGETLQQRILQAVQSYLVAKTKLGPLVLVWEDLHWGDPSSLGLLESILPLTRTCPLLLLLVYRPAREGRVWAFHQRVSALLGDDHQIIELAPLTPEESNQLLDNLLEASHLPEKTRRLIISKAEGNPFYVEEVIRSLIDSGAITRSETGRGWLITARLDDITIPDTLQGVIMARIDRLDAETKRILQVASVIGRTFPYRVLARVTGAE